MTTAGADDFYGHPNDPAFIAAVKMLRILPPARRIMALYAATEWSDERIGQMTTQGELLPATAAVLQ